MNSFWVLLAIFFITLYVYFKWAYQYWKRKNVPTPESTFPFGNFADTFTGKCGFFQVIAKYYHQYKAEGHKFLGLNALTETLFVPIDLDLIKLIMVKDHAYFMDRGLFYNEKDDPLSANLFNIEGKKWQTLRAKVTPTFTSGKMKMMFPTLLDVAKTMEKALVQMAESKTPMEIKEIFAKYTTDVIGSCAFGIDCNSFENPNSEFRRQGRMLFVTTFKKSVKRLFGTLYPNIARKMHIRGNNTKETIDFFMGIVKDTIQYREENNIQRNDFMKLLIDLKNGSSELGKLNLREISAQAFVFFIAGFETSSTTMTFCLYELAQNQELQDKVREEIRSVLKKHDDQLTYEAIKDMKYLQCAIDETLRMYPPVSTLNRKCTKNYQIPDSDIILEKGQSVVIPIYGIHYDAEYFPDPYKFDPDRFSDENKDNVRPFTHLPFGEGPRNCIGLRFGLMQTKVGLITVLKNLKITLNERTKPPLDMDPQSIALTTKEQIYFDAVKV